MSPENPSSPFQERREGKPPAHPSPRREPAKVYLAQLIAQQEARCRGLEALERLLEDAELTPEDDSSLWSLFCAMRLR